MGLSEAQRIRLSDYAIQGSREIEPVFVGRANLFELLKGNARSVLAKCFRGRTVCLSGAPGIGKTAFLEELRTRCEAGTFLNGKARFVDVDAGELHNPVAIMEACAAQIEGFDADWNKRVLA